MEFKDDLRGMFENVGIGLAKVSAEGRILKVNPSYCEMLGYSSEELVGQNFSSLTYAEDIHKSVVWRDELASGRVKSIRGEKRYVHKLGHIIWVHLTTQAITGDNGKVTHFVSAFEDITERKRSEELLRRQKKVLEYIAQGHDLNDTLGRIVELIEEQAPGCRSTIYLVDDGKLKLGAAPSFPREFVEAIDGCPIGPTQGSCGAAAHYGERILSSNIPTDPWWTSHREWIMNFGILAAWSTPVLDKDGTVLATVSMCWNEPKEPSSKDLELVDVATSLMSITIERKRVEERLSESKELERALAVLKATLESTADGILVTDGMGKIAAFNHNFLDMWRLPESLMQTMDDNEALRLVREQLVDPDSFTESVHHAYRSADIRFDVIHFKDGRTFERYSKPAWIGKDHILRVWSFRDVTERKRLEAQVKIADRMASLGRLSAGVAHEINNPLSHVIMSLELACEKLARGQSPHQVESANRLIELAQKSAERISLIVKDLNTFSHPSSDQLGPTDITQALSGALQIAGNQIRHRAKLVQKLRAAPLVTANEGRLNQVLVNLLVNAAQSIAQGNVEENEISISNWTDAQGMVVIEVSDTGAGMSDEIRQHIFDPFFTTKAPGFGTGLGLAISYNIVQSFGGQIEVESTPGNGTAVRIKLRPAHADSQAVFALETKAGTTPAEIPEKRGRILIIDDEDMVAQMMREALSEEHEVVAASDGDKALELLNSTSDRVDLVFCDLMMPGMTGVEVFEQACKTRPGIADRFVFMTGGAFTEKTLEFSRRVTNRIIQKPFHLSAIREIAREATAPEAD